MRSQNPGERRCVGADDWRRAALTRPQDLAVSLPYHGLRPGKVKAGGSRELPGAMF
jgi:hypothetical protein